LRALPVERALARPVFETAAPGLAEELARTELFRELSRPAVEELAKRARPRSYAPGETVFHEGDPGTALYLVRSGSFSIVRPSKDASVTLDRLGPGSAFGELAVLNRSSRLASVVAEESATAIEVSADAVDAAFASDPDGVRRTVGVLASSLTLAKEELKWRNQALEESVDEQTEALRRSQLEVVERLTQAANERDNVTGAHIVRMAELSHRLALAVGWSESEADLILKAAPMHDVGKVGIPDRILLKAGKLEPDEWEIMKTHTTIGAQLLAGSDSPLIELGERIALAHHERWDGGGYPRGLRGTAIPLAARICAICDAFDTLISERPYKAAWTIADAAAEIARCAGTQFDPRLARMFANRVAGWLEDIERSGD
jgi:HD-GYP domain-containing protein (c-di-GMP phosphodiesterase class II)